MVSKEGGRVRVPETFGETRWNRRVFLVAAWLQAIQEKPDVNKERQLSDATDRAIRRRRVPPIAADLPA